MAPIVVRRALATQRDLRAVTALLQEAGVGVGDALAAALGSDAWGVVLLAERAGQPRGVAVVRFLRAPGESERVRSALVDALHVTDPTRPAEVVEALLTAAESEAQARESARFEVRVDTKDATLTAWVAMAGFTEAATWRLFERTTEHRHEAVERESQTDESAPQAHAPPPVEPVPAADAGVSGELLEVVPGVRVRVEAAPSGGRANEISTLWSGALAFRTRWRNDRLGASWSVDGCIGSREGDGDAMRFEALTRALRETYFARPSRVRTDDALLDRVAGVPARPGRLVLAPDAGEFTLPSMDVGLFDLSLAHFVGLRADWVERRRDAVVAGEGAGLVAVAISRHVSVLFDEGRYVGWRVTDPIACVRPMGWPEVREAEAPTEDHRARLASLLYDWMTVDAGPRVRPDEASDREEIAHLVAIRDRARELAEVEGAELDPTAGVARDVAAHIHWGWGFFKVE